MEEVICKKIRNAGIARKLLKYGATIKDIKPSKENPDKTVFMFVRDEIFEHAFTEINDSLHAKKNEEEAQ